MVRFAPFAAAALMASLPLVAADLADLDVKRADDAIHMHHHHQRSARPHAPKVARATSAASATSGSALPASLSAAVASITSGAPATTPSYALSTTFTAGQKNEFISNAPALPAATAARPSDFPTLDKVPPVDSAQAKKWLAQYDLSKVPKIPQTTDDAACSSNAENLKNAEANHWWTCGGYTTEDDITECPDENHWGLSYDDGPSPYTPKLLDYLEKNGDLKSTFFVVGSRAISRPDILQYEYMKGHQLSVHTWSHTALTTQSNEQILLELAWTKEVIRQITGVTPNTMRPPYGDIDDRVRAICKILDLTPIIWTSLSAEESFDTNDWKIQSGVVSASSVVSTFEGIMDKAPTLGHGYIVLEHDLYQQSVDLAVSALLPMAQSMKPAQTLEPIITCLRQPLGNAYVETNQNSSTSSPTATGTNKNAAETSSGSGSGSGSSSGSSGSSSSAALAKGAAPVIALFGSAFIGAALVL